MLNWLYNLYLSLQVKKKNNLTGEIEYIQKAAQEREARRETLLKILGQAGDVIRQAIATAYRVNVDDVNMLTEPNDTNCAVGAVTVDHRQIMIKVLLSARNTDLTGPYNWTISVQYSPPATAKTAMETAQTFVWNKEGKKVRDAEEIPSLIDDLFLEWVRANPSRIEKMGEQ